MTRPVHIAAGGRGCAHRAGAARTEGAPTSSRASSTGTTASAPGGQGAPVAMPATAPAGSGRGAVSGGQPEGDRHGPSRSSAARTA